MRVVLIACLVVAVLALSSQSGHLRRHGRRFRTLAAEGHAQEQKIETAVAGCKTNVGCDACVQATGSSFWRGVYDCIYDQTKNECRSAKTNRKSEDGWARNTAECTRVYDGSVEVTHLVPFWGNVLTGTYKTKAGSKKIGPIEILSQANRAAWDTTGLNGIQLAQANAFNAARATFVEDILKMLNTIASTLSGAELFAAFHRGCHANAAGRTIGIDLARGSADTGGTAQDATTPQSSMVSLYAPRKNGLPPGITVDDSLLPLHGAWGTEDNKPSVVTLFHELVHASDYCFGKLDAADVPRGQYVDPGLKLSEHRATGLDDFRDAAYIDNNAGAITIFSENTFRSDIGVVQRTWYNRPGELLAAPLNEDNAIVLRRTAATNSRATYATAVHVANLV